MIEIPINNSRTVAVVGTFGRGNIGEELIGSCISSILNECGYRSHIIHGRLTQKRCDREGISAIIIGGGSLFNDEPPIELDVVPRYPIGYVSIGLEGAPHPRHAAILRTSPLVIHRSPMGSAAVLRRHLGVSSTARWESLPDIVFSCSGMSIKPPSTKTLLIIPNIEIVPKWSSPHSVHLAWEHFVNEFSQFIDNMYCTGWDIRIGIACSNEYASDGWAGAALLSRCGERRAHWLGSIPLIHPDDITDSSLIISQRYHGVILGVAARIPTISIYHHDKMNPGSMHHPPGASIPYRHVTVDALTEAVKIATLTPVPEPPPSVDLRAVYSYLLGEFLKNDQNKIGTS